MSKIMFVGSEGIVTLQVINDSGEIFSLSGLPVHPSAVADVVAGTHYSEISAAVFDSEDEFAELPDQDPVTILKALAVHLGCALVSPEELSTQLDAIDG